MTNERRNQVGTALRVISGLHQDPFQACLDMGKGYPSYGTWDKQDAIEEAMDILEEAICGPMEYEQNDPEDE